MRALKPIALAANVAIAYSGAAVAHVASLNGDELVSPFIIDGDVATTNPGAATLLWKYTKDGEEKQHTACSATVVASNWILTADHCAPPEYRKHMDRFSVRVNSLNDHSGGQRIPITEWISNYDLMLIRLAEPINNPKIVKLARTEPRPGDDVTVWGWGSTTAEQGTQSGVLKYATARVDNLDGTDHKGGPAVVMTGPSGGPSYGDSGGPMFKGDVQVGVASTAVPSLKIANYSSVAANYDWIAGIIADDTPGSPGQPMPTPTPTATPTPTPTPTSTDPGQPALPNIVDVTQENFDAVLAESYERPVFLEFGTVWCGYCKELGPVMERLNREANGDWLLGHVDGDKQPQLKFKYGVRGYPTVVVLWQGEEFGDRLNGWDSAAATERWVESIMVQVPTQPNPTPTNTPTPNPTPTPTATPTSPGNTVTLVPGGTITIRPGGG